MQDLFMEHNQSLVAAYSDEIIYTPHLEYEKERIAVWFEIHNWNNTLSPGNTVGTESYLLLLKDTMIIGTLITIALWKPSTALHKPYVS